MAYGKMGFGLEKFWISLILTLIFVLSQHDLLIFNFFSFSVVREVSLMAPKHRKASR